MHDEKKHEIREPKESLHWISYNARLQTKLLEELVELATELRDLKKGVKPPEQSELPF